MALATSLTLTAPSPALGNQGSASGNFTVGYNGTTLLGDTITPTDGGKGGTFTPASVTFTAGPTPTTQTFTYTPAAQGAITITVADSSGLNLTSATATYTSYGTFVSDTLVDTSAVLLENHTVSGTGATGGPWVQNTGFTNEIQFSSSNGLIQGTA